MSVLITGGSRGIGAAIARQFAIDGHDVAISYLGSVEKAQAVVADCVKLGVKAVAIQADISQEADCKRLLAEAKAAVGPVSVLVNNAGQTKDGLAMRMSLEQWNSIIATNLTGTFLMCRAILPDLLKARAGRIINLTSVAGLYGNAGQANYAASKAGVIGLTQTLAKEVGSRGITVNAVAPGFIETDMTSVLSDDIKEGARKQIVLGRFGKAEEIAGVISFLASEAGAYITGQVIEVSGGLSL
ncbi:MAG: 3-oxoacyl-[acyl-carrier-protein] reductase [Eubacteriales bacterium]|nr:3-oxoacyl-[acyl-carrier-protein] reductase [Eubacteriales bacterium]